MDFFGDIATRVFARVTGPLKLRFAVQPIIAILLGIRDGAHDARVGSRSFLYDLFHYPKEHKPLVKKAVRTLLVPMLVAIILDGVAQYLLFGWVRVSGAIVAGLTLMGLPYVIAREATNWIVSSRNRTSVSPSVKT
jgi:hypothetical protein